MTSIRSQLRYARALTSQLSGISRRQMRRLDGGRAAVLTYHRVLPEPQARALCVEAGMFVTPETFRRHLEWLTHEYHVLSLDELCDRLHRGASLPERATALTFDDGWRDFYQHAWPELRRAGVSATVFLVTDRVGTPGAFWPDDAWRRLVRMPRGACDALVEEIGVSKLARNQRSSSPELVLAHLKESSEEARQPVLEMLRQRVPEVSAEERALLDWEEVEQLALEGVAFESHTRSHVICRGLQEERLRDEIEGSLRMLRARGLGRGALFAYPSGAYDERARKACLEAGYRAAFTTRRGLASRAHDPMELPRLGLHEDVSRTRPEFRRLVPGTAPA